MAQTEFDIPYQGLRIGRHPFKFSLDGAFFQAFEMEELLEAELTADTVLDRFSSMMHFDVELKGSVRLNCDRCGSACQLSIDEKARFVIQFGRKTERNDDDILVLGRQEHLLNVGVFLYEALVLGLPLRRVHADEADCDQEIVGRIRSEDDDDDTDPRWSALRGLMDDE
jgi:uncharacterized metal-binding protein YceD (DUF177 family)